jgi:hypothetical protein
MLTLILWWTGIFVEGLILVRGFQLHALRRFPFFFFYITSVFCADVSLYVVRLVNPGVYVAWASRAEVLNIVLGYGIILEIFRHVLSHYPGIGRLSQLLGLAIFALVLCVALLYPSSSSGLTDMPTQKAVAERDFLTVQMIFFLATLAVIRYYGLEVSRNIRGIILGYGTWLGASVITLALRAYFGPVLNTGWIFLQPIFYLISLVEWLYSMWIYAPVRGAPLDEVISSDYELLAAKTSGLADEVRAHLGRVARP